jgi:ethanolamine ammonia-lyase small subunit
LESLRQLTTARIGLGRAGTSQPTQPHLAFQLAHARARDAVHHALDVEALQEALRQRGQDTMALHSGAADRHIYLQRPDQGRRLNADSRAALQECSTAIDSEPDVAIVIADGLSALAIEANGISFLDVLLPKLVRNAWRLAPIIIVEQGRVAVGDEVGELLRTRMVVVLIGERPGLSSPDSMGIYLTYQPTIGTTDARRNCISNVRSGGMHYEEAVDKLFYLMREAQRRQLSGVMLKDLSPGHHTDTLAPSSTNLLG